MKEIKDTNLFTHVWVHSGLLIRVDWVKKKKKEWTEWLINNSLYWVTYKQLSHSSRSWVSKAKAPADLVSGETFLFFFF